jgi:hypothetical protein
VNSFRQGIGFNDEHYMKSIQKSLGKITGLVVFRATSAWKHRGTEMLCRTGKLIKLAKQSFYASDPFLKQHIQLSAYQYRRSIVESLTLKTL